MGDCRSVIQDSKTQIPLPFTFLTKAVIIHFSNLNDCQAVPPLMCRRKRLHTAPAGRLNESYHTGFGWTTASESTFTICQKNTVFFYLPPPSQKSSSCVGSLVSLLPADVVACGEC